MKYRSAGYNPIVYSRNGKTSFKDNNKAESSFLFNMKDLHKALMENKQQHKNKDCWKWAYLDPKENIKPYYTPLNENDTTLVFESRFECGNLGLAIKISDTEYNLVLQNDCLTKGNTQCIILNYIYLNYRVLF